MGILKSIPCSTLLTCLILVGCGAGDTPTPTATIAPTEIAPVSASLGISRMRIQSEFKVPALSLPRMGIVSGYLARFLTVQVLASFLIYLGLPMMWKQ